MQGKIAVRARARNLSQVLRTLLPGRAAHEGKNFVSCGDGILQSGRFCERRMPDDHRRIDGLLLAWWQGYDVPCIDPQAVVRPSC
jgi:hypothetical protein